MRWEAAGRMQTENVEGNVLEWGTNLFRGGYCFENSIYRPNESKSLKTIHGPKNSEFRCHHPRDLSWRLGNGLSYSGILNQVSQWFFFLNFHLFSFHILPETSALGNLPLVLRAWEPGLALLYTFCCGARRAEGNGACEVSKFSSKEECAPSQVAEEDTRTLIQQPNYQKTSRHSEDHFLDLHTVLRMLVNVCCLLSSSWLQTSQGQTW